MVPHMGGYSFQPGYAYGAGFPSQHMGGAGSYEQQQQQQLLLPALPAPPQAGPQARLQGPPAFGMPGGSRQNPRWLPLSGSCCAVRGTLCARASCLRICKAAYRAHKQSHASCDTHARLGADHEALVR